MAKRVRGIVPLFLVTSLFAVSVCTAAEPPTEGKGTTALEKAIPANISITRLIAIITAIGALGTAAFGLVEATKAFGGSVSNCGLSGLNRAVSRFSTALDRALGQDEKGRAEWRRVVRSHWINGRPKDEQKAIVKSLIRLGLASDTARSLATAGHVDAEALAGVAVKLEQGAPLNETDLNVLGRLDASIEAQLDAAFNRADQLYRNVARVVAGAFSIGLTFLATWALSAVAPY